MFHLAYFEIADLKSQLIEANLSTKENLLPSQERNEVYSNLRPISISLISIKNYDLNKDRFRINTGL